MSSESDLRSTVSSLWFRLITVAIVSLVMCEGLRLGSVARGWTYYLSAPEVAFEVGVRLIAAALVGVLLGTVATAGATPILLYFKSGRQRLASWAIKAIVIVAMFFVCSYVLELLLRWARLWEVHKLVFAAYYVAFVLALWIPRARKEIVTSLDSFLTAKMTRRAAVVTLAGAVAVVATEYVVARSGQTIQAALGPRRARSNFLLITFDALSAEDMSLYGRMLPTTPNIDALARNSTVFTNFFSASTFTTPSVAAMLTGMYPSESHVYQLQGRLRGYVGQSLPRLMRAGGYATGAFISNPYAYYLAKDLDDNFDDFDVLPEPKFWQGGMQYAWDASVPLHQDSGIGSRVDEYSDLASFWNVTGQMPPEPLFRFRPKMSFEHAKQVLAQLPEEGYFLWVHVLTPHFPYLPDPPERGRFVADTIVQNIDREVGPLWQPHYNPDQQSAIDSHRMAYDEFLASADRAFGDFMSDLQNAGKLDDTTVVVSADHGESFEGGIYQHRSRYQTRPEIRIPLIIRTPGQQEGSTVAITADQTSLAPTILGLAGVSKPNSMRGKSLVVWLNQDGKGQGEGLAFTQYLETNSVFKPLKHGTVGVIDGTHQYIYDLDARQGMFRGLKDAHIWDLDQSAEDPAKARALRAVLHMRFPDLVDQSA